MVSSVLPSHNAPNERTSFCSGREMLIGAASALIAAVENTNSATARLRMAAEFMTAMLSRAVHTSRLRLPAPGLDAKNRRVHTMKKFIFALVALAISGVAAVAASAARPNFIYV